MSLANFCIAFLYSSHGYSNRDIDTPCAKSTSMHLLLLSKNDHNDISDIELTFYVDQSRHQKQDSSSVSSSAVSFYFIIFSRRKKSIEKMCMSSNECSQQ